MSKKRASEFKPLLFTTTIRNPERMKDFLSIAAKHNGEVLTNEVIDKIVFDLIQNKLYCPMYAKRTARLKRQLAKDMVGEPFSDNDTKLIIDHSPQKHKEAGFDKGWPSRFDTWYKFMKELGFIYYEMNKPLEISEAGQNLVLANTEGYEHLEEQVFLSSFAKYQRNNPFVRISNSNKPLILLLRSILKLREIYGDDCAGVSIKEIPLFICWKDDNYVNLANKIKELRDVYSFSVSEDYIYQVCKEILNITSAQEKRFKKKNICHEMPDEFIRKMRMTGLISIRGGGRFIDINNQELEKVKYVIDTYSEIQSFSSEREYYDYAKSMDMTLISLKPTISVSEEESRALFMHWVNEFDLDVLQKELIIVSDDHLSSKHDIFKYIDEPKRLEFLTALAIQKQFTEIIVKPNYSPDDEGMPKSHAQGGVPDIVCLDSSGKVLFEVTLMRGRQQVASEMIPIDRHLTEIKLADPNAFTVFLAPSIHEDAVRYAQFAKFSTGVDIIPIEIKMFVKELPTKHSIRDYL